jgi:hypothetical protein
VVIFTTSHAEDDVRITYDSHANAYITKPVDIDDLASVVAQISPLDRPGPRGPHLSLSPHLCAATTFYTSCVRPLPFDADVSPRGGVAIVEGQFGGVQSALDPCPEFVSVGHVLSMLPASRDMYRTIRSI